MFTKILIIVSLASIVNCANISYNKTENLLRLKRSGNDGFCGRPSQTTSLVIGGSDFERGTWPWMVALMQKQINPPKLFCGGVLVSKNKVLTAAHCIQNKDQSKQRLARDILLLFGVHDLTDLFQSGLLSSSLSKIVIHPDWNPFNRRYDADIAALLIDDDVPYTKYIRPICIATEDFNAKEGWVAGWGESEDKTKDHENIPKQIKIPVRTNEDCFLESNEFAAIASKRTICGGAKDKKGPCRGDSGNGLFVRRDNVFYLKGLVSASLTNFGECDVTNFALYTNVDKFIDWIDNPSEDISINIPTTSTTLITTKATTKQVQNYNYFTATPSSNIAYPTDTSRLDNTCGVMSSVTSLVQGGNEANREMFPWTVAILLRQLTNFQYFSTGSLISQRLIVTTGLSVATLNQQTQKYIARNPDEFRLIYGVSHLNFYNLPNGAKYDDGVSRVILHPSIKHGYPRVSNVGVLVTKNSIQTNVYTIPVCLPRLDIENEVAEEKTAYAVGWGQDDTGNDSNVKKYAKVKIRSQHTCENHWSESLKKRENRKFFCAGGNGRDSACYRDQPLYTKSDGKWTLRGLISIAYNNPDNRCDLNQPVLYEDMGQYRNWLQNLTFTYERLFAL